MLERCTFGALLLVCATASAQYPTGGTDHWAAFLVNGYGDDTRRILITAAAPAFGEVTMPQLGFSADFEAQPGEVTVIQIPNGTMNPVWGHGGEGIHITSDARVSVQLESAQDFTSDVSQLIPTDRMGTSYMVNCYAGMPGMAGYYGSEFVVVAEADSTQVEIIPSATTSDGHPPGAPFIEWLNAGETWIGRAAAESADLTGSVVRGGPENAPDKVFAVFAGTMCANTPSTCVACDHYYEQQLPVVAWSTRYVVPPVDGLTSYSLRVLAQEDVTLVSIDDAPPVQLNAGQWQELNGLAEGVCIMATKPVAVNRYMEGYQCAGMGDPSQIGIMPLVSPITHAVFSAPEHGQIEQHSITITAAVNDIDDVSLDGLPIVQPVNAYPACVELGYLTVPIASGVHELSCPDGCQAQVQGFGIGQSYAFALMQGTPGAQDIETALPGTMAVAEAITFDATNSTLNWTGNAGPFHVTVRDMLGHVVFTARTTGASGVRLPALSAAMYVTTAQGLAGAVSSRFVMP